MEKEYVIGLNRGIDTNQFWQDVEKITTLDNIPNRAIEVANPRSGSNRLTHYYLTDEEAEMIRQDERVYCVEIPANQRDDISIGFRATQTENFTKANDVDGNSVVDATGSARNWGLLRSRYNYNNYGTSTDLSGSYYYTLDGEGVDIVIQDSGIQKDHPEFTDKNGISRVQEINWYTASGMTGSQSAYLYTDYDGHGTHVAGIAAGKTFGFAKEARIYAQKLDGLEGSADPYDGIPISDAFDTIRLWHASKSGSRPTVVNMSWGYGTNLSAGGITAVNYRGSSVSGTEYATDYGIATYNASQTWRINARVSSVDVEIQEMIDAGIIVCIASGNLNYKIDVPGGLDYDNYFTKGGTNYYYHRGSSPYDDEAFIVGSVSYLSPSATTDEKSSFSNAGPGVNIYAPGHFIMSAESNVFSSDHTTADYNLNNSFKQAILSGTSMASPQVAGVAALALQVSPAAKPQSVREALINNATSNILISGSDLNGWSTGGSLNTARHSGIGFGTQNEALMTTGFNFPSRYSCTEEYNGSSWSAGGTTINARSLGTGAGTQNAGLITGGYNGSDRISCTEEYNGSSWTAGGDLINARQELGGAGTQNAGLAFGGWCSPTLFNATEEYNGSSWSTGGTLITSRAALAGAGTQNAGLAVGGSVSGVGRGCTEEYNGTSWSTGGSLISGRQKLASSGTQNAGIAIAGFNSSLSRSSATELYNGSSWSTSFNLNCEYESLSGAGSTTSALAFGGVNTPGNVVACTEEFTSGPTYVNNCDYSGDSTMGGPTKMLWNRFGQDPNPFNHSGSMNISTSILLS